MSFHTDVTFKTDRGDRVRNRTSERMNGKIEHEIAAYAQHDGDRLDLAQRVWELEQEWDTESVLGTAFPTLALMGLMLELFVNYLWFWLAAIVLLFVAQQEIQGWRSPLPNI